MLFKRDQKSQNFWATFEVKFVAKNFQKSPNLVTLLQGEQLQFMIRNFVLAKGEREPLHQCDQKKSPNVFKSFPK